jgi:hypothetical protein
MLRSMNDLKDYTIHATDGNIGHVKDFYFDDKRWVIRYLIVDTGGWLSSRKVLISPIAIGMPNWRERMLPVSITKEQVKNSPDIDTAKPVSRQHEIEYLGYYNYPLYWGGMGLWGEEAYPNLMVAGAGGLATEPPIFQSPSGNIDDADAEVAEHQKEDPDLRSCVAVTGYGIKASDGEIGHVTGFLVDEETWAIRYMIVETGNWWLGHKILVAPQWIDAVSWVDAKVSLQLTRQAIKDAPAYDPSVALTREQESEIYRHYGHPGYWASQAEREEVPSPD